jgi:phosphoglycerate dehydrogenase-like enzyme
MKVVIYTDNVQAHAFIPRRFPQVELNITDVAHAAREAARTTDVLFLARKYERDIVFQARHLRWLHLGGTGIDRLLPLSDLDPDVTISHTPGLNAEMIADYVMCVTSMLAWDFPRLIRNQLHGQWERWPVDRLEDRTLVVIGLGNIGRAVVRRAQAAGMHIIGVKRTPEPVSGVQRVVGPTELHSVLSVGDFVVLAVPLTPETAGMIGALELQAMQQTAYLINVGRGPVVQQEALVAALRQQDIAGAALDVFEQEPLPADSELWSLDNAIISPHMSSWSGDYRARAAELFCVNLERYLSGMPLLHVVNRSQGY